MKAISIILFLFTSIFLSCGSFEGKNRTALNNMNAKRVEQLYDNSKAINYALSTDSLMSALVNMKTNSLDCSAEAYWKIVKRGKESIPLLIESLTDTTPTFIYNHCKKGKLNFGEVCYFALGEIAQFPAYLVTGIQFCLITDGCFEFYDWLYDNNNKAEYQEKARAFYYNNKYQYFEYSTEELNDCHKKYNITGHYKLAL